eukprot:gnl/TRDRNA2_/TRDRNA2_32999_c0_seq1.p1 gnl/TRDRNA2_/TRDRNA2_32999_c0~~gnl/TRDRNA2_/TRDRNA2_32999_c0_seq1.p1  ORF type:complete len:314 (-),score=46.97 gnl/TRDRNA2_/TRDRNA2_32999_c0_seq1:45-986(-)
MGLQQMLKTTPLACRIVALLSIGCYLLYVLDYNLFLHLNLVLRVDDAIRGWNFLGALMAWRWQRLIMASFVHTSLIELCFALFLCWRRFAWMENKFGTLGFIMWFVWASLFLHATYVYSIAFVVAPIIDPALEVTWIHGLYPVLTASFVIDIKESDNHSVWLWPLPVHVPVRAFPWVIIVLSWVLHCEAHLDVVSAYFVASFAPVWMLEPSVELLDKVEQTWLGMFVLAQLQRFDAFVYRQPSAASTLPRTVATPAPPTAPLKHATTVQGNIQAPIKAASSAPTVPKAGQADVEVPPPVTAAPAAAKEEELVL